MGEIRPHLIRYWLHSSEKTDSPETFTEKVSEICAVYHEAETVHENGGHTISVDEMTGMEKPYLNPTHTEDDFVEAIRALAETDLEAPWTFVCDGLNTHKSESLVRFVAGQCGLSENLGSKGKSGILKNLESRAEFLHQKDHRIRVVYTKTLLMDEPNRNLVRNYKPTSA